MTERTYNGYRFEHSRPDASVANGVMKVHIIAVAESEEAALKAVAELMGSSDGARLIDSGASVLDEANRRRLGDGMAVVL